MSGKNLIDKSSLKHLAELARIKLTAKESDAFLKDIKKILHYFKELEKVDTDKIEPMSGGTSLINVLREDRVDFSQKAQSVDDAGRIIEAFPESDKGYLKVPKVL